MILAIDPGNEYSAYVLVKNDLSEVVDKGKVTNEELLDYLNKIKYVDIDHFAIEMVASYGMAVGKTVFDTCVWVGRFTQVIKDYWSVVPTYIYRKDEKMCLCGSMRAKDSNIRQALIDRFGEVGTKKNQGYFYGFKADIWASMSVAVTYHDMYMEGDV